MIAVSTIQVRDEVLYVINAACLAGMLAFVADGFFSFSLRVNAPLKVFWLLAAMIIVGVWNP